jgi:hypothetical protein
MSGKRKWRSLCVCKGCDTFDCQLHAFVRRRRAPLNGLTCGHSNHAACLPIGYHSCSLRRNFT